MTERKWEDIPEEERTKIIRGVASDLQAISVKISMIPFSELAAKIPTSPVAKVFSDTGSFGERLRKDLIALGLLR